LKRTVTGNYRNAKIVLAKGGKVSKVWTYDRVWLTGSGNLEKNFLGLSEPSYNGDSEPPLLEVECYAYRRIIGIV